MIKSELLFASEKSRAEVKTITLGPKAQKIWDAMSEEDREIATHWLAPGMSSVRVIDLLRYIHKGYGGVRVVQHITRGAAYMGTVPVSRDLVVEIRGATQGRWGKCVDLRVVPILPEERRFVVVDW